MKPPDRAALLASGFAPPTPACVKQYYMWLAKPGCEVQRLKRIHIDHHSKFLVDFPNCCLIKRFAWFNLAPGKLP